MECNDSEEEVSGSIVGEEAWLIYSITVPLSTAIVLVNLLVILGIACNRQLHTAPNYLFLSLLVADLCMGVTLPFIPWMGLARSLSFRACLLAHVLPNFLFLAFLFNLVLVHLERYLAIARPLLPGWLWLHRRFPLPLLAAWLPALAFSLLPAFGWNNRAPRASCCPATGVTAAGNCSAAAEAERCCTYRCVFPDAYICLEVYGLLAPAVLSIAGMTGRVLWITRGQLRGIRAGLRGSERRRRLELRYARCVAAVSLSFLACWAPYIVYTHVTMTFLLGGGAAERGMVRGSATTHIALTCAGVGGMATVPLVLALANREYTDPARKLLRKLRHRWGGGGARSSADVALRALPG